MTTYYADDWLTVYLGDCREVMASMPAESVHCVVTSPPYWGLRDYGTATWVGGELDHEHVGSVMRTAPPGTEKQASNKGASAVASGDCRCGATRVDSQLGLEPTPEAYVESMVAVFREVKRVLRKDGTVWLNLGDSYANANPSGRRDADRRGEAGTFSDGDWHERQASGGGAFIKPLPFGLKPKDLVGIPWRVAFALQTDGWYLRSDIIWSKPNPMPESVTDRPTKAHEYVFLLSKSPRYYYDADAVREAAQYGYSPTPQMFNGVGDARSAPERKVGAVEQGSGGNRNLRSVWTIATQPYPGAHFATFPRALVEPCIKAGTSEKGVCPECGAPWVREVETRRGAPPAERGGKNYGANAQGTSPSSALRKVGGDDWYEYAGTSETIGWSPSCAHGSEYHEHVAGDRHEHAFNGPHSHGGVTALRTGAAPLDPVPATVLDPFAGSGTTGLVAQSLSRRAVLIDLSADYLVQLMDRNRDIPLGLGG